jgi:hypothetical protein
VIVIASPPFSARGRVGLLAPRKRAWGLFRVLSVLSEKAGVRIYREKEKEKLHGII